jgi:hypothetical protein
LTGAALGEACSTMRCKRGTNQEQQDDQTGHDGTCGPLNLIRRVHYASQRPTILPKIGSANGDANGSQLGRSTGSRKTVLKLGSRSPLVDPVDIIICLAVPRHIGKDLIKIDPGRGCRCGRKHLERNARTKGFSSPAAGRFAAGVGVPSLGFPRWNHVVNRRKPPIFRLAANKMVPRCFRRPALGHSRGDRLDLASGGHVGLASWRGIRYV